MVLLEYLFFEKLSQIEKQRKEQAGNSRNSPKDKTRDQKAKW